GADSGVVEERVALSRRAVAANALSLRLGLDEDGEELLLGALYLAGKIGIGGDSLKPAAALLRQHIGHPDGNREPRVLMSEIDAERSAMRRQSLDVDQREPRGRSKAGHGAEREIGEMLVIDRIELVLVHQALKMRHLYGDHAFRRQEIRHAGDEFVELRHLR